MTLEPITGQNIWDAFTHESVFTELPISFYSIVREFIDQLPAVVGEELLGLPVRLTTLAEAKRRYLQYRLDNQFYERLFPLAPVAPDDMSIDDAVSGARTMVNWLNLITTDPQRYQEAYGQNILTVLERLGAPTEVVSEVKRGLDNPDTPQLCLGAVILMMPTLVMVEDF